MEYRVYLVIGCQGSGRTEVVQDLIEGSALEPAQCAILLDPAEEQPSDSSAQCVQRPASDRLPELAEGVDTLFWLTDGRASPADGVEHFLTWFKAGTHHLGQVLTLVHCSLLHTQPEVAPWFECALHFSDSVLLNRREGVEQKWINDYTKGIERACMPCQLIYVKKGRVDNPYELLETMTRRLSIVFEERDAIDELEFADEEDIPEEPFDLTAKPDPWLERDEQGRRLKPVPDITEYL